MYIISVGAGKNQLPLIERLYKRGYKIISFDKDIDAPGKSYSYEFNCISTWDYKIAIKWLDSLELNFQACVCFSYGKALITQQKIIQNYKLNGLVRNEYIESMKDKRCQREILYKLNLSELKEYQPSMQKLGNIDVIVKDKMGGSSLNIFRYKDIRITEEFLERYIYNDQYIVQEYIEGIEYRLVGLIQNCDVKFMAIMERNNFKDTFLTGRLNPTMEELKKVNLLVNQLIEKMDMIDTPIKIDLIKQKDRMEIIEIDFGIGGDYFESYIAPVIYNYDYIDSYINLMLGVNIESEEYEINNLCFDYVYNINKQVRLIIDYKKIIKICDNIFSKYKIIYIKKNGEEVNYPKNNMDAIFAIMHDRKDLTNYEINTVFNEQLYKVVI